MLYVVLTVAFVATVLVSLAISMQPRATNGFERIVRCRAGHLFTTTLVPGASFKALRLGRVRYQRCPVGQHWAIVSPVDESTLSPAEIAEARANHDVRIP
jgi:hypothetical protein